MRTQILFILFLGVILGVSQRAPGAPDAAAMPVSRLEALIEAAGPGEVVRVPPGVYQGNLVIRKPVVLDGGGAAVIDGQGKGTVVVIVSKDVTFRGFRVIGSGSDVTGEPSAVRAENGPVVIENNTIADALFGIDLRESPGSIIRNNSILSKDLDAGRRGDGIRLWWSRGCVVEDNTVHGSRDMVFWYSEDLHISRNKVTASRYGLHFMYSHDTVLTDNELSENSVGIYLMYSNGITLRGNRIRNNRGASGYGIGLKDCDDIIIADNMLIANRIGVYVDNSPSSLGSTGLFEGNTIAFNEIGLLATPNTHDNVLTGNAFIENEEPAATHGRGQLTKNAFSLDGVGNYWSEYAGFDQDRDGIGDVAYEPRSLFGVMLAKEPNLRIFVHSPAQRAIEFTARALPELRPEATLVDPAPLTSPPVAMLDTAGTGLARPWMGVLGAAMIGLAGAVVFLVGRERDRYLTKEGVPA